MPKRYPLSRGGARVRDLLEGAASLLVPAPCLLCAETLPSPLRGPICAGCIAELPRVLPPYCSRCGLPYPASVAPGECGPCRSGRAFRRARAGFVYEGNVRRVLHALKFAGCERVAGVLGGLAPERWLRLGEIGGYDAVVPVPLSPRRRRERGFNQAERAARAVARRLSVPVRRALRKPRDRPPQAGLAASARRRNVSSAFTAKLPRSLFGSTLLLVDDVLTTGATAEAAARELRRAGAEAVDVLTLARVP